MESLDSFTTASLEQTGECSECGSEGVIRLSESHESDTESEYALCGPCLLKADGRFKNSPAGELIKEHEEVQRSFITTDNTLRIQTESVLGDFTHVYYLDEVFHVVPNGHTGQEMTGNLKEIKEMEGPSDVFDSDGSLVTSPSWYPERAWDDVTTHNKRIC